MVAVDKSTFTLVGNLMELLDRGSGLAIQATADDKGPDAITLRNAQVGGLQPACCPACCSCSVAEWPTFLTSMHMHHPARPCAVASCWPSLAKVLRLHGHPSRAGRLLKEQEVSRTRTTTAGTTWSAMRSAWASWAGALWRSAPVQLPALAAYTCSLHLLPTLAPYTCCLHLLLTHAPYTC